MLNLSSSEWSAIAEISLGILPLHVETGRFVNKKLEEQTCKICHSDDTGNECHFLFNCHAYEIPRNYWVTSLINKCPNFHTLELNQLAFIFNEVP